jgi:hypothetical protein
MADEVRKEIEAHTISLPKTKLDEKIPPMPKPSLQRKVNPLNEYKLWDGSVVVPLYDIGGHMIGATNTSAKGVTLKLTLAPFPMRNLMILQKNNERPFTMTIFGDLQTYTINANSATQSCSLNVKASELAYPQVVITASFYHNGVPDPPYKDEVEHISGLNSRLTAYLNEFPEYVDITDHFTPILRAAQEDLGDFFTAEVLTPIDPNTGLPIALLALGWGTVGRGVVWGLAGAGGVILGAPVEAVGATVLVTAFLLGFDASVITEVWSASEDGGPNLQKKDHEEGKDGGTSGGKK